MKKLIAVILSLTLLLALLPAASAASPVWDGRSSEAYAGGTGTEDDPYLIANGAQLYQLALDGNDSTTFGEYYKSTKGLYYKLTQDIDMGNKSFPGITYFSGNLDGAGHTICNLKIITTSESAGLIKNARYCSIESITIKGSVIGGGAGTGGFIGVSLRRSYISDCVNFCKVSGTKNVGGICGYDNTDGGGITSSVNYGTVSGTEEVGGICGARGGRSFHKIDSCINYGAVSGTKRVGGICGDSYNSMSSSEISSCENYGTISGTEKVGGISGCSDMSYLCASYHCESRILSCKNYGIVCGTEDVGGICGYGYSAYAFSIRNCINYGAVSGTTYVGGICGSCGSIESTTDSSRWLSISSCANYGTISGTEKAGGICAAGSGGTFSYLSISRCSNLAAVSSTNGVAAGIVISMRNVYNCYNSGTITAPSACGISTIVQYLSNVYNCGIVDGDKCSDPCPDSNTSCSSCYYLSDINEAATHHSDAVGLTSEEMISASSFKGFDFANVWTWDNTGAYPYPILRDLGDVRLPCENGEHEWNSGTVLYLATCMEEGQLLVTCTKCAVVQSQPIPALGHDYASVVTEPTCTEAGYTTYTCETCGHSYTGDAVPATGHDYEDGSCTHCGAEDPDWTGPEDPFVNPFIDVKENDYFYDPVLWAVEKGITNGTTATTFSPEDPCTRGQIVTFLWRAFGSPEPEKDENPFTDVPENMYYYKAILWAVEQGITTGTSATTFSPEDTCTRGQVATFLWRACGKPAPESSDNPFSDVPEAMYYYEPILWAVEEGVTNGTGNGKFSPDDSCTRGQIVTFLYRALAK